MNERSSLNQINIISKDTHLSTKLDIELLILDLLKLIRIFYIEKIQY
jgi:hypothetical protein